MAEADFNFMTGGLNAATVARGVSAGFTPPNGGGTFVFGFHSLATTPGAVGLYANQTNFDPLLDDSANATGGSVRGAIQRGASGGPLGFAPFLFIGVQGTTVNDQGYLLGLSDNDPHEIILRKGSPVNGLSPTASGVLRTGSSTFIPDTWLHLRLDMIVNPNGDVVLKVFESDLTANPVTAPVWAASPGIADFIDDALGVNSGSAPFTGGRVGFGFETSDISRRGFFDHLEILRQK
jgi:hypothetical protein